MPDLATHAIPDRVEQSNTLTLSNTVPTSGVKTLPGIQATGIVQFINSTTSTISLPAQFPLTTASGVRIQTLQQLDVPAHDNGKDGKAAVAAVTLDAGAAGNIPAHALDGTCCNNGLNARNPAAFSGGADGQQVHTVAQADLDGVQSALTAKLQPQINQALQQQLGAGEIMATQPSYSLKVSSNTPVGAQADQVQVQVSMSGKVVVYNHDVAGHTAAQLLNRQVGQTLSKSYQLQGAPTVAPPRVVEQGKNGIIYLNVSVRGVWTYTLSTRQITQWRQMVRGATQAVALAYLSAQPGVADVQIHLPFGADHVPSTVDEIRILVVNITQQ
jgi:hypothetical protein